MAPFTGAAKSSFSDRPQISELPAGSCRFVHFGGADLPFDVVGMSDVMPYPSCRFIDLGTKQIDAYHAAFDRRLQEAAAEFHPDLIHSHHLWLLSARVRRLFPGLPLVTSRHGTDLRQFRQCAHLRPHVAGAGYDETRFYPEPKPAPDPVQILFAGKLSRTKGAAWLMKALARIDAPDWHLTLVGGGSGKEKEEVLQIAGRLYLGWDLPDCGGRL